MKKQQPATAGRKSRWAAVLTLFTVPCVLFTASSCALPRSREAEHMMPVEVMGVDEDQGVRVTVWGRGAGEELTFSRRGKAEGEACLEIQRAASAELFYGHVGQLLVGERLAAEGLASVLTYVAEDPELRLDMALFLIRGGEAQTAITRPAVPAAERLEAMARNGEVRTIKDVLIALEKEGAALVPALALVDGEEGWALADAGYGVLEGDLLVGWQDGAEEGG